MVTSPQELWTLLWHNPRFRAWLQFWVPRWQRLQDILARSPLRKVGTKLAQTSVLPGQDLAILAGLWGLLALVQQVWLALDRQPPSWDPGWHLTGSLNYWWVITHPQIFSGEWWQRLLILSSSTVPFLYVFTVPVRMLLGPGADAGVTVNLFYGVMVVGSVYGLGRLVTRTQGAGPRLGLWAAALCLLFPRLYTIALQYAWDYGAMAWATTAFLLLTLWRLQGLGLLSLVGAGGKSGVETPGSIAALGAGDRSEAIGVLSRSELAQNSESAQNQPELAQDQSESAQNLESSQSQLESAQNLEVGQNQLEIAQDQSESVQELESAQNQPGFPQDQAESVPYQLELVQVLELAQDPRELAENGLESAKDPELDQNQPELDQDRSALAQDQLDLNLDLDQNQLELGQNQPELEQDRSVPAQDQLEIGQNQPELDQNQLGLEQDRSALAQDQLELSQDQPKLDPTDAPETFPATSPHTAPPEIAPLDVTLQGETPQDKTPQDETPRDIAAATESQLVSENTSELSTPAGLANLRADYSAQILEPSPKELAAPLDLARSADRSAASALEVATALPTEALPTEALPTDPPVAAPEKPVFAASIGTKLARLAKFARSPRGQAWGLSLAFGLALGCTLYTKQTLLIFFVTPLLWLLVAHGLQRRWERVAQLGAALGVAGLMLWPWFSTNWIFQIGAGVNSFVSAATAEGDPPFYTAEAWLYYLRDLPKAVSWPILGVGAAGWGLHRWQQVQQRRVRVAPSGIAPTPAMQDNQPALNGTNSHLWRWYAAYILGGYVLWSLISNKDGRYIMPYLPLLSLFLAQGLGYWRRRWWRIPWITIGFSGLLLVLNLFPIGGGLGQGLTALFAPDNHKWPDLNPNWPQETAIATVAEAQPYQLVNVGLIGGSATVNTHTLTFYGLQRDFRIYSRPLGDRQSFQEDDLNSLGWFLTQQDPQVDLLSLAEPNREQETVQKLLQDPRFSRVQSWPLPDGSELQLFRRDPLPVTVEPLVGPPPDLAQNPDLASGQPVYLEHIDFAPLAPPGSPVPITYTWVGPWSALSQGLVMLDWHQKLPPVPDSETPGADTWIHDHGIGLGTLPPLPIQANQVVRGPAVAPPDQWFRVTEHTAMLPPAEAIDGIYGLQAHYLNARSGEIQPLDIPSVAITIDRDIPPPPSLAVDWASQLRDLAPHLAEGREALDQIFDRLGRVNLYDPIQNYLLQAEKTLEVRLDRDPSNLDYAYALALDRVLQRDAAGAIAALKQVAALDAANPFAHAYVAVVHLIRLQPRSALRALEPALALAPDNPELQALQAAAKLMTGNLWGAWHQGRAVVDRLE